ncbi:hypothetical protein DM02DRAFT_697423, partial [Periconia macrospinosa]
EDNSPIHKAGIIKDWFKRNKISLFPHSPYSPDLAPIENVWSLLKDRLVKLPKAYLGIGPSASSVAKFKKAILEEWEKIPQKSIDNCILSIPRRYKAVIEAKGYYTKY